MSSTAVARSIPSNSPIAVISSNPSTNTHRVTLATSHYDLAITLNSGQAFRWLLLNNWWEGVIGHRWVRLRSLPEGIEAESSTDPGDWSWLNHYLQIHVPLHTILDAFPKNDPHLQKAVSSCHGLRLLRQDPWECLASFILSSTKQITQIRQIISLLSNKFGHPIPVPKGHPPACAFPDPLTIARLSEPQLRACKTGFRAPALLHAARRVASNALSLHNLAALPTHSARQRLTELPGVGDKIANCVLLFAYGKADAFPVDVWILRTLRNLYFPHRQPKPLELRAFIASHFGPQAGYAQQYLFHYARLHSRLISPPGKSIHP